MSRVRLAIHSRIICLRRPSIRVRLNIRDGKCPTFCCRGIRRASTNGAISKPWSARVACVPDSLTSNVICVNAVTRRLQEEEPAVRAF